MLLSYFQIKIIVNMLVCANNIYFEEKTKQKNLLQIF